MTLEVPLGTLARGRLGHGDDVPLARNAGPGDGVDDAALADGVAALEQHVQIKQKRPA